MAERRTAQNTSDEIDDSETSRTTDLVVMVLGRVDDSDVSGTLRPTEYLSEVLRAAELGSDCDSCRTTAYDEHSMTGATC